MRKWALHLWRSTAARCAGVQAPAPEMPPKPGPKSHCGGAVADLRMSNSFDIFTALDAFDAFDYFLIYL